MQNPHMVAVIILIVLSVIACVLLVGAVLIQNPREGGLTAGFGAAFSSQFFGIQQAADFLEKATWVLISIIAGLAILINIILYSRREPATELPLPEVPAEHTQPLPTQEGMPLSPPQQ